MVEVVVAELAESESHVDSDSDSNEFDVCDSVSDVVSSSESESNVDCEADEDSLVVLVDSCSPFSLLTI